MTAGFDARRHSYDERSRGSGMIYVLMLVVAVAFGGFVWQLYSGAEPPRIAALPGPYKVEPPPDAPSDAGPDAGEGAVSIPAQRSQGGDVEAASEGSPGAGGGFVAQLAALQSEAAVEQAWRRFNVRDPALFASAELDVQRADLGARGIYYRVRAGYFASRAEAAQFCGRIRELGQDCIPAAR